MNGTVLMMTCSSHASITPHRWIIPQRLHATQSPQIIQIKYFCCGGKNVDESMCIHDELMKPHTLSLIFVNTNTCTFTHTLTYRHHTTTFGICLHKLNIARKSLFLTEMTSVPWLFSREHTGIDKLKEHFLSYLTRKCNKHNRYNAHLTHTIRKKKITRTANTRLIHFKTKEHYLFVFQTPMTLKTGHHHQ